MKMSKLLAKINMALEKIEEVILCMVVISLSDGNNIHSNRRSSEWELIIVNSMDNSFSLTPARASDRIATKIKGFWNERKGGGRNFPLK